MKDLDFDELDQAVSSVLGGDTPSENKEALAESPATMPKHSTDAETPASDPVEAAAPAATPVASPARRRGQFLDMVHPKSDMTSRTPISPAARKQIGPVSKNLSVPPTSEERAEKAAAITAAESEPKPVSHSVPTITETPKLPSPSADLLSGAADEAMSSFDAPEPAKKGVSWPDPLDLSPENNETSAKSESAPADEKTQEPDVSVISAPESATEFSSTPFMTDTKVDKRPLGAFGSSEPEPSATPDPTTPATGLDEQRVPEVTPPELQPDVVSVESADKEFASEPGQPESTPDTHEEPANSGLSESISQQYRTPADVPDPASHPIFDTNEYHQPLLPATNQKKKHGWLIVLIILALLVVGSALGYFAFVAGF